MGAAIGQRGLPKVRPEPPGHIVLVDKPCLRGNLHHQPGALPQQPSRIKVSTRVCGPGGSSSP